MAKIVRDSKFRHVFAEECTKERFEDLRPSSKATESPGLRANSKFLSVAWDSGGGGTLAVFPITQTGRMKMDVPLITGHRGPILDFEWNPFDDNMLISAGEDLTIKIWQIPDEGLKAHLKEPLASLEGHGKKVSFCTFNRSAGHIFATSAFDMTTKVWNLAEQDVAFSIDMPDQVWSLKWNYTGSLLATTSKDKKLRIIDPRASKFAAEGKVHDGSKAAKVEWLGRPSVTDEGYKILTTGFSSQAERQIGVWDLRKFGEEAEPLNLLVLDQGTGALYPFYDPGTGLAFFAGKGDGNCRYFEMTPADDPYIHFISQSSSKIPQKGFDFLPKRCVDVMKHEVMRGLKLESNAVMPVSFRVPRKSEAFQEDLFPECPSMEPALTADAWVAGTDCLPPKTMSMAPGADGDSSPKKSAQAAAPAIVSVKDLKKQLADAQERIKALEAENADLKERLAKA